MNSCWELLKFHVQGFVRVESVVQRMLEKEPVKEEMERDFVKYDDIFGGVQQQHQAVSTLARLLELREEVLEERSSLPAANTGPSLHCPNVNYGNI